MQGKVGVVVNGASRGGELEAALIALVEFAVGADFASLLVLLALADHRRDARGFAGKALDAIGPAHLFQKLDALFFGVKLFVNV
jgi:hypothetical protein